MGLRLLNPGVELGLGRVCESGEGCACQTWGLGVVPIMYHDGQQEAIRWRLRLERIRHL